MCLNISPREAAKLQWQLLSKIECLIKHRAQVWTPSTHLGVGHRGQGAVDAGGGGGHGEQRGDGEGHAGGGGLVVQPEAHPGHAHRHKGRDVDREHVVRQLRVGQAS